MLSKNFAQKPFQRPHPVVRERTQHLQAAGPGGVRTGPCAGKHLYRISSNKPPIERQHIVDAGETLIQPPDERSGFPAGKPRSEDGG